MHEVSLAAALLPVVLEIAAEHGARVASVTVQAGELAGVVPASLELAFHGLAAGTAAEDAALVIETVAVRARCRRCSLEFEVDDVVFLCPVCDVADCETLHGTELLLTRVELSDAG